MQYKLIVVFLAVETVLATGGFARPGGIPLDTAQGQLRPRFYLSRLYCPKGKIVANSLITAVNNFFDHSLYWF
jgi:hypothetical protein